MGFDGKVVIVTGASSGIGAETCVEFAKNGAHIAAVGRNLENLKNTEDACLKANPKVKCLLIQADITKDSQKVIEETIEAFGKIDVLVNNAGIAGRGSILEADLEQLDRVMDTNVRSIYQLTKLATPHLIKSKGNVVNVSSVAGIRSFATTLTYCMSKAALDQFTQCMALDLAPYNVRVNSVNPAVIVTSFHKSGGMDDKAYAEYLESCKKTHALGRVGHVSEVAPVIVFLASDAASFMTGALVPIDGGKNVMCPR